MELQIPLSIIITLPTIGVVYGLQKGTGSIYETIQKQTASHEDLLFSFVITIKGDKLKDEAPKFSGPFVHGPTGGKFIYIDIGTCAGQINTPWSRRLKIPLTNISWQTIDQLIANPQQRLTCNVPGTGKDGGPNCATVKPFTGWQIKL